ncbi:uncharacterized protein YraI [Neorhizobium galegae]|uniref:DUF1236 domain-containing protein n=1 Tax=Neorhizobium galegae TaxID=399 RepID=UPI001AE53BEE|nr:DUF1236 domain-containing protein [Neorhizobium galegae]MBP2558301.1 uncharacterized protein YraI [Neorhizobium galegae]MDQ0137090.1 uncharacterized protein YraI [Neorhizobium galegae]
MTTWLKCPELKWRDLTWLGLGAVLSALALPAQAQMTTTTASDIIVRSGPGQNYPEIGMATRGSPAMMDGCLQGSKWCRIDVNGMRGWVYAEYLTIRHNGSAVAVEEYRTQYDVPSVTYETTASVSPPAAVPGPGDILLGPVGAVEAVEPPETVISYIEEHPVQPVYVRNEVAIGATLPPGVVIQQVPDYDYDYVVVNDRPVLVDPGTRRIVHIYD